MDAGEQSALDGRREQAAVFLNEDVVDGAFGDFAAKVEKQHFVVARLGCGFEGFSVEGSVGGFVEEHGVAGDRCVGSAMRTRASLALQLSCGRRQEFAFDLKVAIVVEEKADFAGMFGR